MNPSLIASLCTMLADPDRFHRDALFAVLTMGNPPHAAALSGER